MSETPINENEVAADAAIDAGTFPVMRKRGNLPVALVVGAMASIGCAGIWAAVAIATDYQIAIIAIGIGFLIGWAIRSIARGDSPVFGVIGGAFSLIAIVLGNAFALIGFIAQEEGVSFTTMLTQIDWALMPEALVAMAQPMDFLFYAVAIYYGFRQSFSHAG